MKKYLGLGGLLVGLFFLQVLACGTSNSITEVGNPSSGPSGSLAAATDSAEGATSSVASSHNLSAAFTSQSNSSQFNCSYNQTNNTSLCQCKNGGTLVYTFDKNFGNNGNNLIFNNTFIVTLTDCILTSCDISTSLNGQYTGSMEGTISLTDNSGDLLINIETDTSCSGLTAGDETIGFSLQISETNFNVENIAGSICINNQPYTFSSSEDLQNQIDPEQTCNNIFH